MARFLRATSARHQHLIGRPNQHRASAQYGDSRTVTNHWSRSSGIPMQCENSATLPAWVTCQPRFCKNAATSSRNSSSSSSKTMWLIRSICVQLGAKARIQSLRFSFSSAHLAIEYIQKLELNVAPACSRTAAHVNDEVNIQAAPTTSPPPER